MPWEHIGDCGNGRIPEDHDWIIFCLELGISYLKQVCGDPPNGCKLGVMWDEHELGDYPSIGLHWEGSTPPDAPWDYIDRCESALRLFDRAVEWSMIYPANEDADPDDYSDAEEFEEEEVSDKKTFDQLVDEIEEDLDEWERQKDLEGPNGFHTPRKHHYVFVHQFLRDKVHEHPQDTFETLSRESAKMYLSVHWVQHGIALGSTLPADGIECFPMKINNDCFAVVVQLPQPERMGEAYFAAIVYWPSSKKARYLTLELTGSAESERQTFLCEWINGSHFNYGQGPQPDRKHFIWAVMKHLGL